MVVNLNTKSPRNTTLILCGVHGDEITPIKFCYDIMKHVESNKKFYSEKLIVIAPIVNPDSFFGEDQLEQIIGALI